MESQKWSINFFKSLAGEKYVEQFILTLPRLEQVKVVRLLDLLEEYGPFLRMPYSKKISSHLYELRVRGQLEIRMFYTFVGKEVIILSAFKKKTQKIPQKELEIAFQRLTQI